MQFLKGAQPVGRQRSHLETKEFTTERVWTVEDIPVLQASVTLPEPVQAEDGCTRRIRRFYHLQRRAFLRYCNLWLYPQAVAEYQDALAASRALPLFQAALTYRVTWNEGGFWSLYTQQREQTGQTLLRRWGDTWDLREGYPVPMAVFFPARHGWKRQLLQLAAEEIQRQEAAGVAQYHEAWRRELRKHFDPKNYYLTEEGLSFFYPMFAIAPAAEQIPAFLVPGGTAGLVLPAEQKEGT